MGSGSYCSTARTTRATSMGYYSKSVTEIFNSKMSSEMKPSGALLRESCDNDEHPDTLSIIVGLDLTGSMGRVPQELVKDGLPTMMSGIIENGVKHPQILFLGIGDHECDSAPLQVGQFESSDELIDKWLTDTYLEGGGGGNGGESYLLAWYYAAYHTAIDCFDKRGVKGIIVTIGDEPTLKKLPREAVNGLMGSDYTSDYTTSSASELLERASERYDVYHIHVSNTYNGRCERTITGWRELLGDNLIVAESHNQVADIINNIVCDRNVGTVSTVSTEVEVEPNTSGVEPNTSGVELDSGMVIL